MENLSSASIRLVAAIESFLDGLTLSLKDLYECLWEPPLGKPHAPLKISPTHTRTIDTREEIRRYRWRR